MSVRPAELLARLSTGSPQVELIGASPDQALTMVTHDSREVRSGALFCCVVGRTVDGHDHAAEAVAKGAVALLCERPLDLGGVELRVDNVREAMGHVAAAFHDHPSRSLEVVGVTGTNGKTTVTWWLQAVLEAAGRSCGLIGTIGGSRTTPEATDLQAMLAAWRDEGRTSVAMEVSSHALALSRVEGTWFSMAVFTNLGRDHLDFHPSREDYFKAKAKLFDPSRTAAAVVNIDDPHGRLLLDAALVPTRAYGLADVTDLHVGLTSCHGVWQGRRLEVPAGGSFNVSNALAAATAALELGLDVDVIVEGLARAVPVPGRFQAVHAGQPFGVIVDYAHTPDGLDQMLQALRPVTTGRVIVVFGCGGDRDQGKRALMGEVAVTRADIAIATSDNPRSEDPRRILDAIVEGAKGAKGAGMLTVEEDRRTAIARALSMARADDLVLVAGKGHETTQTVGDAVLAFDDAAVVAEEWGRIERDGVDERGDGA